MIALLFVLALADVRVVELTRQDAIVTTVTTTPKQLSSAITTAVVSLIAAADSTEITGPPFARYQVRDEKRVVVEIGVPVRKPPTVKKPLRTIVLPGGPAAELVFTGRHEDLPQAHAELTEWLARENRTVTSRWEVYVTNPITTPNPAAQQTRIVAPLRQRDGT
jgi:effector-binding domain-containing protein